LGLRAASSRGITFRLATLDDVFSVPERGDGTYSFDAGIQRALARILVDPRFIFRMEKTPANIADGAAYRLAGVELATRLAFFCGAAFPTRRF
jgi:hypothetical protein